MLEPLPQKCRARKDAEDARPATLAVKPSADEGSDAIIAAAPSGVRPRRKMPKGRIAPCRRRDRTVSASIELLTTTRVVQHLLQACMLETEHCDGPHTEQEMVPETGRSWERERDVHMTVRER